VDLVPELVSVIRAFAWSPPSGDPTGIAWDRRARHFVVTDSEIDELATYAGSNLWFMNVRGSVLRSGLLRRTSEPTDVAIDPSTGTLFVSDDGKKRILVVAAGADGRFGTADDSVASLPTQDFGSKDPEGLAFGQGTLFVADGTGREVYRLSPGPNGRFDGVPPRGDDQVFSFDVAQLGLLDPEGIAFSPGQATLYILDRARNGPLMEVSTAGALIRSIDLASLGLVSPSGLAFGPASDGSDRISIYITDRGTDNARNPFENDGRVLEVRVPGVP
jgi:DNA-binding beta-propeller fold protein YncE